MSEQTFNEVIETTLEDLKELLIKKGKEYRRNNDVFHNFHEGAKRTGLTREQVLQGFLLKHEISVGDLIKDKADGKDIKALQVSEKMDDILIYNLLLKAMLIEEAI